MSRYRQPFSLYKRGDYWYYRTYDANGQRTSAKSTGLKSKTKAIAYLSELFKKNELLVTEITFGEYAKDFLSDNSPFVKDRSKPLAPGTIKAYRCAFKHLYKMLSAYKMKDISYSFLKAKRVELLSTLSTTTIKTVFLLGDVVFKFAVRDGVINNNPFSTLEALTIEQDNRHAFYLSEIKHLMELLPQFKKIFILEALTGMRISEAVGVRISDIKEKNGIEYIDLNKQLYTTDYTPLKTKDKRIIPIISALKEFILHPEEVPTKYDFYANIKPAIESVLEDHDRNISNHSMRHFFVTNTKSKGVNPDKVEVIVGHRLQGMKDVYTNFMVEDLSDILNWQKETLDFLLN